MRDIAKKAGVAVATVYASFGSKTDLLLTAIDVGVLGDAEPVALSQRPEFKALGSGSFTDRLDAAVRMITRINERTWGLRRALSEAAGSEPQLGPVVWGTGSGSTRDPDWFLNLRAARVAEVQIGRDRFRTRPQELTGAARETMWTETILAQAPEVVRYARKAHRTIPVAFLHLRDRLDD